MYVFEFWIVLGRSCFDSLLFGQHSPKLILVFLRRFHPLKKKARKSSLIFLDLEVICQPIFISKHIINKNAISINQFFNSRYL